MEKEVKIGDVCVCCGKPVPEGRMVCYACETESGRTASHGAVRKFDAIKKLIGRMKGDKCESK